MRRVRSDEGAAWPDRRSESPQFELVDDEDDALQISPGGHEAKKKDSICVIEGR